MRYILALAFVVCLASLVEAQTVVIDTPVQQREGVLVTPSWTVPADAAGELDIQANIPTADYENVTHSLIMRIYVLVDGVWRAVVAGEWHGGPAVDFDGNPNPAPYIGLSLGGLRGKQIRGEAEIPVRMRVGFTLSTVP